MTRVLAVMSDLFFSMKIIDAAKRIGATVQIVKDKAVASEKIKELPAMVIFDLNCTSADPVELIRALKSNPETAGIRTIGFVSHVQAELRQQAVDSGCDVVVARSAFAQNLDSYFS